MSSSNPSSVSRPLTDSETHFYLPASRACVIPALAISDEEFKTVVALAGPNVICSHPTPGQNIVDPPSPLHFGVHLSSLRMGLMLPLHPFVLHVLSYYDLVPGQLATVAHLFLAGFMAQCVHLRILLNMNIFRHFFYAARSGAYAAKGFIVQARPPFVRGSTLPRSHQNWEQKWVWITPTNGELPFVNRWGELIC
ncbi:unnamed protein product [Cuscuta europaea]|uniref:Transposase (putative) gypsy type domain-containing protein n=1 Tax=Cuscuta europaea TaxID=41803 RepID=A0A9P1E4A5_CUSEU|nr:unnamed protein product [Cuscuta europaea]